MLKIKCYFVLDPVVEDKLSESRKAITNKEIDIFNYAAQKIL